MNTPAAVDARPIAPDVVAVSIPARSASSLIDLFGLIAVDEALHQHPMSTTASVCAANMYPNSR